MSQKTSLHRYVVNLSQRVALHGIFRFPVFRPWLKTAASIIFFYWKIIICRMEYIRYDFKIQMPE